MNFKPLNEDNTIDVNLTPLIDVVFLLLIFFMVTTKFAEKAIKIDLPTVNKAATVTKENIIELMIDSQGRYHINGKEVLSNKPETLFKALSLTLDESDNTSKLMISADANTNYQYVITAMDIAGRLGITSFSMPVVQSKRK